MQEDEKRVVIRVTSDEWLNFDDKRHAERTSFQELGLRLLRDWHDSRKSTHTPSSSRVNIHDLGVPSPDDSPSESETACIHKLLNILRSGNEIAVLAITSNLVAFSGYVKAVPEAPGGFADLAAYAAQLALIDKSILDTAKAAKVGGRPGTSAHGRDHEKETRGAGAAIGDPRKKVR